ncbi:hypothetical protein QFC21_007333 [Naganishia friedmannii]|uniref:Uncharacterized protein n=1 Tax=Naganishia friedmannii TaxID=89922 RepID=A0ACC2UWC5_9TREE|nr:hypothetical protein QFC21_007333 [Naganishia friedmannii]
MSQRPPSRTREEEETNTNNKRRRVQVKPATAGVASGSFFSNGVAPGEMPHTGHRSRAGSITSQGSNAHRAGPTPRARSGSAASSSRPSMRRPESRQGSRERLSSAGYSAPSESSLDEDEDEAGLPLGAERELVVAEAEHQGTHLEPRRRNKEHPVIPFSVTSELRRMIANEATQRRQEMQRINPTVHAAAMGGNPNPVTLAPPSAPLKHYICPMYTYQVLAIHDAMVSSQNRSDNGVEAATEQDVMQFATTYQCAWVDKYLSTIAEITRDPALVARIPTALANDEHLLVQHLFPAQTTRLIDREPFVGPEGVVPRDTTSWETLDAKVNGLPASAYLGIPLVAEARETTIPAAITYDVDSVIVYSDTLPVKGAMEIRAVPNPKDTFRYTNHLADSIDGIRVPLSSIPNFRLGTSGRLSINMMFPSLYTQSATPSPQISLENQGLIWDQLILPAMQAANSTSSNAVGPGPWSWEYERHKQKGQQLSFGNNKHLVPSCDIADLVIAMRRITEDAEAPNFARSLREFKFLISLQGSKTRSMIDYNSFVQEEAGWMRVAQRGIREPRTYFRQIMTVKAYLKGLRMATKDDFTDDWLDFSAILDEAITKIRRYVDWKIRAGRGEDAAEDLDDEVSVATRTPSLEEHRRIRKGPSFLLDELGSILSSSGLSVWVDLAVQFFAQDFVTFWDQKCGARLSEILLGDSTFNNLSFSKGVRLDEIAGIPGRGGIQYTNKLTPHTGVNNPIVSLQLYAQEKILMYKARGNKDKGSNSLGVRHSRELPLWVILDARTSPSDLKDWLDAELAIFNSAHSREHFAARIEVRANLESLLDAAWNITIAREEVNESHHLIHVNNTEWHRWKSIRAVNFARLPTTLFRLHKSLDSWTIMQAMLTAQGQIHALHSRPSDAPVERGVLALNTRHLEVSTASGSGRRLYQQVQERPSLTDRYEGGRFADWYPAGVRTIHEWFHPSKGLYWRNFKQVMRGQMDADDMWRRVVSKGVRAITKGPECLPGRIRRDLAPPSSDDAFSRPLSGRSRNLLLYQEDVRYDEVLCAFNNATDALRQRKLVVNASTTAEISQMLRRLGQDPLDLMISFATALGLKAYSKDVMDLIMMRDGLIKGRTLERLADGRYKIIPQMARIIEEEELLEDVGLSGEGDPDIADEPVSHFQGYIPLQDDTVETVRCGTNRRPEFLSAVVYDTVKEVLRIPGLDPSPMLCKTLLPPAITEEEREDEIAFVELCRQLNADAAVKHSLSPTVNDYFVFVAGLFQIQLLEAIPDEATAGKTPGDKFWRQDLSLDAYTVSANLLRESYAGICGRLAHFSMTHATSYQWKEQPAKWMPLQGDSAPRWWSGDFTYASIWLRFVERVGRSENVRGVKDALYLTRDKFILSFRVLPCHEGSKYDDKPHGHRYIPWDQAPHQTKPPSLVSKSKTKAPPRWYSVHRSGRTDPARIKLMYNFTHELSAAYWGFFKTPGDIGDSSSPHHRTFPSPPPFEICWLWHNSDRVLSEKSYCMLREAQCPDYYGNVVQTDPRRKALGHDWWCGEETGGMPHNTNTCTKCKTFRSLNPNLVDNESLAMEPWRFKLGNYSWGQFAASP